MIDRSLVSIDLLLKDPSQPKMEMKAVPILVWVGGAIMAAACCCPILLSEAAADEGQSSKSSFEDNFDIMWSEDHFKTSEDGQIWYLSLDNETGIYMQYDQMSMLACLFVFPS